MATLSAIFTVFVILHGAAHAQVTYTACEDGWIPFEGSCYKFDPTRRTHALSQQHCQQFGAHLVHVNSITENNFVKYWLHFYTGTGWWLGLTDTDQEGQFLWTDKSQLTFTDWYPGQPNNYQSAEDCVQFHKSYAYQWSDTHCTFTYSAICEKTGQPYQVNK